MKKPKLRQIQSLQQQIGETELVRQQVQQMVDQGIITQANNGQFQAVQDPSESEQIRSQRAEASKRKVIDEADIDRINADLDRMEQDDDDR